MKERKERKEKETNRSLEDILKEEECLKEINNFTWTSNTRKSQVHFMMKSFV